METAANKNEDIIREDELSRKIGPHLVAIRKVEAADYSNSRPKVFLTEEEAVEFCNVGKTIFRRGVSLGLIPFCIFPGSTKRLFHLETLEQTVKNNHREGLNSEKLLG